MRAAAATRRRRRRRRGNARRSQRRRCRSGVDEDGTTHERLQATKKLDGMTCVAQSAYTDAALHDMRTCDGWATSVVGATRASVVVDSSHSQPRRNRNCATRDAAGAAPRRSCSACRRGGRTRAGGSPCEKRRAPSGSRQATTEPENRASKKSDALGLIPGTFCYGGRCCVYRGFSHARTVAVCSGDSLHLPYEAANSNSFAERARVEASARAGSLHSRTLIGPQPPCVT